MTARTLPPRSWVLEIPGRPPTANSFRNSHGHWSKSASVTKDYRTAACVLQRDKARKREAPNRVGGIEVTAWQVSKDRRWLQDVGAQMNVTKAVVDGLVDAGLIPDDTADYVRGLSFLPPVVEGRDALCVRVAVVA